MVAPIGASGACQTVGVSSSGADRRARLRNAHLYFVADRGGLERALDGALRGGADLVQLRDKTATDEELAPAAAWVAERCAAHGALFILNDRPALALAAGADGVHVGQDDMPVAEARAIVGEEAIVGLSTHSIAQADAGARSGADYLAVGPIHETPTKEGRSAIGLEPIRHAAAMLLAAWGMWRRRYWAVLGFAALMALITVVFSLLLLIASNVLAVVVCLAFAVSAGVLFWKLIRVMARLQAPPRVS